MDKYLVIQQRCIDRFRSAINQKHEEGYDLKHFQVVSDAGDAVAFFGIMEKREPTRFYLEPMVG